MRPRFVAIAALAALSAAPDTAEATAFPILLLGELCWAMAPGCVPGTPIGFRLQSNNTFVDAYGDPGQWRVDPATRTLELSYGPPPNAHYSGTFVGNGCFEGTSVSAPYFGTWSVCVW